MTEDKNLPTTTESFVPATIDQLSEALPASIHDDSEFTAAVATGDFLPRLQLMTANSEKCSDGSFPINHYALVSGQNHDDLGDSVVVAVLDWSPKAIEMGGDVVITVYKQDDPEFERIAAKSTQKDSGCMFGIEFLVWIPETGIQRFATFFMGSKSSRREAPNVKAQMHKLCKLVAQKIETRKYTWFAPKAEQCSDEVVLPPITEIQKQVEKFRNPPKPEIEVAPEADAEEEGRAR